MGASELTFAGAFATLCTPPFGTLGHQNKLESSRPEHSSLACLRSPGDFDWQLAETRPQNDGNMTRVRSCFAQWNLSLRISLSIPESRLSNLQRRATKTILDRTARTRCNLLPFLLRPWRGWSKRNEWIVWGMIAVVSIAFSYKPRAKFRQKFSKEYLDIYIMSRGCLEEWTIRAYGLYILYDIYV